MAAERSSSRTVSVKKNKHYKILNTFIILITNSKPCK